MSNTALPKEGAAPRNIDGTNRCRAILRLIGVALLASALWYGWERLGVYRVGQRCAEYESREQWGLLLDTALIWSEQDPTSRTAAGYGFRAATELQDSKQAAKFLSQVTPGGLEDVPHFEKLIDLEFGVLRRPHAAAAHCRQVLEVAPDKKEVRQRLIYYLAMTHQPAELIEEVRLAVESQAVTLDMLSYYLIADSLLLSNGEQVCGEWLKGNGSDETLRVASLLHRIPKFEAQSVPVDDALTSRFQQQRELTLRHRDDLLVAYPRNLQLMARQLDDEIKNGNVLAVAKVLEHAPAMADRDARFWRARGWVFIKAREYTEAESALKRALSLHPLSWRTRFYLAEVLRNQSGFNAAEREERLASTGRQLESRLLEGSNAGSVKQQLMLEIAEYVEQCGESDLAKLWRLHAK